MADHEGDEFPPNQQALNPAGGDDHAEPADPQNGDGDGGAHNVQIDEEGIPPAVLIADLVEAQMQARAAMEQMNQTLQETREAQRDLDQQREELAQDREHWQRADQRRQELHNEQEAEIARQQAQAQQFIQQAALAYVQPPVPHINAHPPPRGRDMPQQAYALPMADPAARQAHVPHLAQNVPHQAQAQHQAQRPAGLLQPAPQRAPAHQQGAQNRPGAQAPRVPQVVHQGPPAQNVPGYNAPPQAQGDYTQQDIADMRQQLNMMQPYGAPQHQVIQQMTLEEFHGKEGDDWLGWKERIESLFDDQGLPYARRRARFHLHLRGSALTFWSTLPDKENMTWQQILQRFDARYASPEVADHYEREFTARRFKGADEAPHDYLQELTRLAQLAFRAYTDEFGEVTDARERERENAIKKQFIQGMPPRIRNALIMKNHPHTSALELANYARKKLHADKVTKEEEQLSDNLNNLQAQMKKEGGSAPSYSALVQAIEEANAKVAASKEKSQTKSGTPQWKKKLIFTRNPPAQAPAWPTRYAQPGVAQYPVIMTAPPPAQMVSAPPAQYLDPQAQARYEAYMQGQPAQPGKGDNQGKGKNGGGKGGGKGGRGGKGGGKGQKRPPFDMSQITCHYCGEKGHMHNRCSKMLPLLKYMPAHVMAKALASAGADKCEPQNQEVAPAKKAQNTACPVDRTANAPTAAQLQEMQLFQEWRNSWGQVGQVPAQVAQMEADTSAGQYVEVYEETEGSDDSGDLAYASGNE